jgi:hypothetical protein
VEKTCGGKKYANLDRVSVLSLAFLLIFTAFNSADNLAAKVLREDGFAGLGFYSIAALYLVFAITGFVSKGLVRKLSGKSESLRIPMFIGGLCYFVRILFFLLPAYFKTESHSWLTSPTSITVLIIVTAMLNGFGAGILWVAQGEYLSLCASEETKGFYFSYFFVIFMISQIIGNLVAGFVIRLSGQPTYYWSMSGLSLVGCFVFLVLQAPRK